MWSAGLVGFIVEEFKRSDELPLIARHRRHGGDSGEDGVHFFPIHAGGAFGDGGAKRGVIELRGEGAGDEGVHRDVFALDEFAGLRGEAVWQLDDDVHDAGSMTANSRGARRRCRCGGRV